MSTQYNFPARRPEQTFLCSVNASVWQPTPDPDRPHCVYITTRSKYLYYSSGSLTEFVEYYMRIIHHSVYPLFVLQEQMSSDPTSSYYYAFAYAPDIDREARTEIEISASWKLSSSAGEFTATVAALDFLIPTADLYGGRVTPSGYGTNIELVTSPPILTVDSKNGTPGNRLDHLVLDDLQMLKANSAVPEDGAYKPYGSHVEFWYTDDRGYSAGRGLYHATQHSDKTSYGDRIVNDSDTYVFNFNNPLFNSGQAWLDYCKSL